MTACRIALVSEHASPLAALGGPDAGGQNVHVDALAMELAAHGCQVSVATRRDNPDLPSRVEVRPGYVVEHVDAGPPVPVPKDDLLPYMGEFARQLGRRWHAERPDVVHAHFWMSGVAAYPEARRLGIPFAQTFHALGRVKRRHQGTADTSPGSRDIAERELATGADVVVATCRDELRELQALGARTDRVEVVPCGVDPVAFDPCGPSWPRAPGRRRLVVLARLVPRKGVADAIAALANVPETDLVVAGGPPASELHRDPEVRRLLGVAQEHGVASRVQFVGALARGDVPALIRSADLVVCPPWYEPFGIVPLEAMGCGVPVVGTAVGGLLDTVVDGETGLLVPPRDPAALARALCSALDHPDRRRQWGMAATRRVRELFTWSKVGTATRAVYEGLIDRREPVDVTAVSV